MIDIKQTESGDIDLSGGDIAYTESTAQHQRDILLAAKGHYKGAPTVGVGIEAFLHDENPGALYQRIRQEFAKDGLKVKRLGIVAGNLEIDAAYPGNT